MTSERTSNFGLPLYTANDITSWLVDFNGAMNEIDTAMQGVKTIADQAGTDATGAAGSVAEINQTLVNIQNSLAGINNRLNSSWVTNAFTYNSKVTDNGTSALYNTLTKGLYLMFRFTVNTSLNSGETIISGLPALHAVNLYGFGYDGTKTNDALFYARNNTIQAPSGGLMAGTIMRYSGVIPTNA